MAPDTLSGYLTRFDKKYDLPHIHAQVSTTQNIYSHLIEWHGLLQQGIITQEEFNAQKEKLLK